MRVEEGHQDGALVPDVEHEPALLLRLECHRHHHVGRVLQPREGSTRFFQVFDLCRRSPESGVLWYRSRR